MNLPSPEFDPGTFAMRGWFSSNRACEQELNEVGTAPTMRFSLILKINLKKTTNNELTTTDLCKTSFNLIVT